MAKQKIRNAGHRSKGGRKKQDGERYPNGRLKPAGPNQLVVDRRRAMCDDVTKATNPLDVALYRGWLNPRDYDTGHTYARLHHAAGFGRTGAAMGANMEVDKPMETSLDVTMDAKSYFSGLPHAEVTALWDSVFNDDGRPTKTPEQRATEATIGWKKANAAMTAFERAEVASVCIDDSFPQWIIQRAAGHMDTSWERKRDLLISGLRAVRQALKRERAHPPAQPRSEGIPIDLTGAPARVTERTVYLDEATGEKVLEVERVSRRGH